MKTKDQTKLLTIFTEDSPPLLKNMFSSLLTRLVKDFGEEMSGKYHSKLAWQN